MEEKRLQGSGFPDDTGAADAALAAALASYDAGGAAVDVLVALRSARVLVPVVAILGEVELDEQGLAHDKSSDMAAVLLTGADGRSALLGFTGTAALRSWDPAARPVPVTAQHAAQAAVQDGAAALVLDLAGPVRFVVEDDDLRGLAGGWELTLLGERSAWIAPAPDVAAD